MNRIAQAVLGIFLGLFGVLLSSGALGVMFFAHAFSMWGGIVILAGIIVTFVGGLIIPNSGVEEGAHKFTILVNPFLDLLPGGRRRTDPPPSGGAP